jgi:hypothetical protein
MGSGWGGHVTHGVTEFAALRVASALAEAEDADAFPLISFARLTPARSSLGVAWSAEDDDPGLTTSLHYRTGPGQLESQFPCRHARGD